MISNKPYLIRAFYEWIVDSECTPFVLVNAEEPGTDVPEQHIENGKIIFNLSPKAVRNLHISNRLVEFDASFGSDVLWIRIPVSAVLAIYAQENGRGLVFENPEEYLFQETETETETESSTPILPAPLAASTYSTQQRKPKLTIIK